MGKEYAQARSKEVSEKAPIPAEEIKYFDEKIFVTRKMEYFGRNFYDRAQQILGFSFGYGVLRALGEVLFLQSIKMPAPRSPTLFIGLHGVRAAGVCFLLGSSERIISHINLNYLSQLEDPNQIILSGTAIRAFDFVKLALYTFNRFWLVPYFYFYVHKQKEECDSVPQGSPRW